MFLFLRRLGIMVFLFIGHGLDGQNAFMVSVVENGQRAADTLSFSSRAAMDGYLEAKITNLLEDNHLEASLDSLTRDNENHAFSAYIHKGPRYDFSSLSLEGIDDILIPGNGRRKRIADLDNFIVYRKNILDHFADNGYPFARVLIEEASIVDSTVTGRLRVNEGPRITIDSIILEGNVRLRPGFLENYLGIHKGDILNYSKLLKIDGELNKLTFLRSVREPDLSFFGRSATLTLFAEPRNTSRFDVLFGVIPTTNIEGQSLFLSLDINAELLNKLGYGEYLFFEFERLRPEQQKLDIKFNYPYLLDLPFAVNAELSILRNAFNFQTLVSDLGIQYLVNTTDYLKLSWNFNSSRIIDVDTVGLKTTMRLPETLDVSVNGIGLESFFSRLDYRLNPYRGYSFRFKGTAGQKEVHRNSAITRIEGFEDSYDTLDLNGSRFSLEGAFSFFQPLSQRATLGLGLKGGWLYSDQGLLFNELFQVGGNKILRGFDEGSIFTNYYGIASLEYRLLLTRNSYFTLPFLEIGMINPNGQDATWTMGFGGGLTFDTSVGLFSFSIAVGRTRDTGFDLGRPKAHFGFISLF